MSSWRRYVQLFLPLVLVLHASPRAPGKDTRPHARMGINFNGPFYYNTELPFVDVFRISSQWISQREGGPWGKGPPVSLDEHGWVTKLEPGCSADKNICTIRGGHYPGGIYTVLYEGEGVLEGLGAATTLSRQPGKMLLQVDPRKGGIQLRLRETNPSNYVRNIRVIMPGFVAKYRDNPWHPLFLQRWKGMACLRFMDLMKTNYPSPRTWSERASLQDATFFEKGVPLELLIDLANRLKADAWFCVPHQADDEYVREMATMVKAKLAPGLRAYLEYSNEVWNGTFKQHHYAAEEGKKLGLSVHPWEAAWKFYAHRSVQIFAIWQRVFGSSMSSRVVRVLATQTANAYVSKVILTYQDAGRHADALAIGPYITLVVFGKNCPPNQVHISKVSGMTVPQLMDLVKTTCMPTVRKWITEQKEMANAYGLKLIAYEGGQHLVGATDAVNDERLTKLLMEANNSPAMGALYDQYFDLWQKSGGDLFCYFQSIGMWDKWGSWGICQFYDEPPLKAPKYSGVLRAAKKWGQPVMQTLPSHSQ